MRRSRLLIPGLVVLGVGFIGVASPASSTDASGEFTITETREAAGFFGGSRYLVAASDDRFLIVWLDSSSDASLDVRGLLVDGSSGLPVGNSFPIAEGVPDESAYALASDGTRFIVTWTRGEGQNFASFVDPDGTVVDPGGIHLENAPSSIVWNGVDWVAAWTRYLAEYSTAVVAKVELASGAMSKLTELPGGGPDLTTNGATLLISATDATEERCVEERLYPVGGGFVSPLGTYSFNEGSATNGSDYLAVYACYQACEDPDDYSVVPRAYSIEIDGATGHPRVETRRAVTQTGYAGADVAFAGGWLIAHEGPGDPGPDIFVNEMPLIENASWPRIAVAGDTGLVIASRGAKLVGRTFAVSDPPPTLIPPSPTPTASAPTATPTAPARPPLFVEDAATNRGCTCGMSGAAEAPAWTGLIAALLLAGITRVAYARSVRGR